MGFFEPKDFKKNIMTPTDALMAFNDMCPECGQELIYRYGEDYPLPAKSWTAKQCSKCNKTFIL